MTLAKPVDRETYARHTRNKLLMNPSSAAAAVAQMPTLNPYAAINPYATLYQPFVLPNVNPIASAAAQGIQTSAANVVQQTANIR